MKLSASELLKPSCQFKRCYARQFAPLLADTTLSMNEIHVLLFLANNPG